MWDFISVLHEVFQTVFIMCRCVHYTLLLAYVIDHGLSVRLRWLFRNGWRMNFLRQTTFIVLVEAWGFIFKINGFLATSQITLNVDVSDHLLLKAVVDCHGGLAAGRCILASHLMFLLQYRSLCFSALPTGYYCLRKLGCHSPTRSRFNRLPCCDGIN